MRQEAPPEALPRIGTVEDPAYVCDGRTIHLAYEIASADGGGYALLTFTGVVKFVQNPQTVEGARNTHAYPITPWGFTELFESEETTVWRSLTLRFWTLSFNDITLAITFKSMRLQGKDMDARSPREAVLRAVAAA